MADGELTQLEVIKLSASVMGRVARRAEIIHQLAWESWERAGKPDCPPEDPYDPSHDPLFVMLGTREKRQCSDDVEMLVTDPSLTREDLQHVIWCMAEQSKQVFEVVNEELRTLDYAAFKPAEALQFNLGEMLAAISVAAAEAEATDAVQQEGNGDAGETRG